MVSALASPLGGRALLFLRLGGLLVALVLPAPVLLICHRSPPHCMTGRVPCPALTTMQQIECPFVATLSLPCQGREIDPGRRRDGALEDRPHQVEGGVVFFRRVRRD